MLNKADFSDKGYEVDEDQFPKNPDKAASTSGRGKQNIDVVMLDDDSEDDTKIEEEAVAFNDDPSNFPPEVDYSQVRL
jgi:hypothetical protein